MPKVIREKLAAAVIVVSVAATGGVHAALAQTDDDAQAPPVEETEPSITGESVAAIEQLSSQIEVLQGAIAALGDAGSVDDDSGRAIESELEATANKARSVIDQLRPSGNLMVEVQRTIATTAARISKIDRLALSDDQKQVLRERAANQANELQNVMSEVEATRGAALDAVNAADRIRPTIALLAQLDQIDAIIDNLNPVVSMLNNVRQSFENLRETATGLDVAVPQ